MKLNKLIAATAIGLGLVTSQAASAYNIDVRGHTRASSVLMSDVLATIGGYSKATGGCSFVFSVDARVMGPSYRPSPISPQVRPGVGHYEQWMVNVCAKKQVFQVAMWDSPRGGTDYAVSPMTGTMPLWVR